jgi:hypothetical protein
MTIASRRLISLPQKKILVFSTCAALISNGSTL